MRAVEAVLALSTAPTRFTASELAEQVRTMNGEGPSAYAPRQAAYCHQARACHQPTTPVYNQTEPSHTARSALRTSPDRDARSVQCAGDGRI